jgi:hypothetical protein
MMALGTFGHLTDDRESKCLQPIGVGGLQVMFRRNSFHGGGKPPIIPIESKIRQRVIDFLQMTTRGTVASMTIQYEDTLEAMSIRRADNIFHCGT